MTDLWRSLYTDFPECLAEWFSTVQQFLKIVKCSGPLDQTKENFIVETALLLC